MLLQLRNDNKEHLNLLINRPLEVLASFCKLAVDFLQNGPNLKMYGVVAQKLGSEQQIVQNCVFGIVNLLLLSCKEKLNEADFRDSLLTLGFSSEQQSFFIKLCESKRDQFREILATLELQEPNYHDLDWRFEIVAASRSLPEQVTPIITLDLQLKMQNAKVKRLLLQTDVVSLVHVTHELEKALNESKGRHCRRIERMLHSHS